MGTRTYPPLHYPLPNLIFCCPRGDVPAAVLLRNGRNRLVIFCVSACEGGRDPKHLTKQPQCSYCFSAGRFKKRLRTTTDNRYTQKCIQKRHNRRTSISTKNSTHSNPKLTCQKKTPETLPKKGPISVHSTLITQTETCSHKP